MRERKEQLDALAVSLLVACCLFWGFQQILIKSTVAEVPPLWQASIRFAVATVLLSLVGIWALPSGGLLYGLLLLPFNGRLLQMAWNLHQAPDDQQRARGLFRWSIFYLFGICLLLMLARLPAGDQLSRQGLDLLGLASGSGAPAFTLAAPAALGAF